MKPINLLPDRYRPAAASGGGQGSAYVLLAALGVLLLCVLAVALTQKQIGSARAESARLASERASDEARATRLGDFERFQLIKQTRLASVSELAQARVDWERLLRELARVLPAGVRLTSLQAAAGAATGGAAPVPAPGGTSAASAGPTLTLGGCAPGYQGVAATLVRLRRLHRAEDVRLASSSGAGQGDEASSGGSGGSSASSGGEAATGCSGRGQAEWGATVTLTPEPTPAGDAEDAAGVPASLGGGS